MLDKVVTTRVYSRVRKLNNFVLVVGMAGLWDELRKLEGMEYPPASWFWVPNDVLVEESGRQFSYKPAGRPVVLARISGPLATVYPRSTSRKTSYEHTAHNHEDAPQRCVVNKDGWITFRHPITISAADLANDNYSCLEPVPDSLIEILDLALRRAVL